MTEEEWLTGARAEAMANVALQSPRASDRTCRLFVAAFWGWQSLRLPGERGADLRARVGAMEHWAETGKLPKGVRASRSEHVIFFNRNAGRALTMTVHSPTFWESPVPEAFALQPRLLRDIFGNPFRPPACDPAWLTSDVLALARGIYDDKAFDRMPILADALQDAGCDSDALLTHLRDPDATHVRGCWVLDLLLGKG